MQNHGARWLTSVLLAGVVAGTLDIGAAALINHANPKAILQGIAGVAFESAPHAGEVGSAILGLLVQWGLSIMIAAIGIEASARIQTLRERWVVAGVAYGVVIFAVMNYIVLPLSRFGHVPHFTTFRFIANVAAMLVFGLIVAVFGSASQNPLDFLRRPAMSQKAR